MVETQSRRQQKTRPHTIHGLIAAFLFLGSIYVVGGIIVDHGWHWIVAYPIGTVLGLVIMLFYVIVIDPRLRGQYVWLVPSLVCHALRSSESRDLGAASKITGAGRITRSGQFVIWTDASDQIEAELERVLSATASTFETHLGLRSRRERTLRILVFERETDCLAYVRGFFRGTGTAAGYHLGFLQPRIVICSDVAAYRHGLFSVAAHEMAHHCQHQCLGGRRPPWLEEGIATLIQERVQPSLHPPGAALRYLRAEAARGTLLTGSDLLTISYWDLHACVENQDATKEFLTIVRLYVQSVALCNFLLDCDPDRLKSLLRAGRRIRRVRSCARMFEQIFNSNPDDMMESCLADLRQRSLPPFTAPPDDVKHHIESKLVPLATGTDTSPRHRIRAIRTLGLLGYPWRADVLMQSLSDADKSVRAEAAISLANLSGESLGANVDAWREWLHSLPADSVAPVR